MTDRRRSFAFPVFACLVALACTPAVSATREAVALDRRLDLADQGMKLRYATSWTRVKSTYANATELRYAPAGSVDSAPFAAKILLTTETRLDHADAVDRLRQIAQEESAPASFLVIGGWPALQRSVVAPKQTRGEDEPGLNGPPLVTRVTTAIAAGSTLVRIEGTLPGDVSAAVIEQVLATGRSVVSRAKSDPKRSAVEVEGLRTTTPTRSAIALHETRAALPTPEETLAAASASNSAGFTPQRLQAGSEIEMVTSNNGLDIVVASQNNFRTSNNGGFTFPFSGSMPFSNFGDPSLAIGLSGTIYWAGIHNTAGCGNFGCGTAIAVSTDQGHTFTLRSDAVVCPNAGATRCFPDQEHIAADRVNAGGGGGDQVYSTWRNFDATDQDPALVCSQDSGTNWTAPITVGAGFVPRINVGQDGFVYVIYRQGGNIMLHKYSSCASGLTAQAGFPRTVGAVTDVTCPMAGLDRCNDGNILSSHMVAVDDTNANHVYVTYATNDAAGNERIVVRDSLDGGTTWLGTPQRVIRVNTLVTARRFMPWICTTGGRAYVSWYDRRLAAATNDLTDFFGASAALNGSGDLVAGPEVQITNTSDPECASGWPCSARATADSESCTTQPQLAGFCCTAANCPAGSSFQRCDFSSGPCPAGESCFTSGGCPKYGDYNGNACAAGRFYSAWASATPPSGIPAPPAGIQTYFASVVNQPPVANAGPDQTLECTGSFQATALLDGSASSDPDGFADIQSFAWSEGATPLGNGVTLPVPFSMVPAVHTVTLTVLDRARDSSSDTVSISVQDTTKPDIGGVPPNTIVECNAVPPVPIVTVTDNCDPNPTLVFGEVSTQTHNGTCSDQNYTITRTWTATDAALNQRVAVQVVTVKDTTPPTVVMTQPNHDTLGLPSVNIPINVSFTSHDNCAAKSRDFVKLSSRDAAPGTGCVLFDGNTWGDRDGMLSDESMQVNKYQLCQAMARCGMLVLYYPTLVAESTDPCGNTGSDRHIIRLRLLKTEVCGF